MPKENLDGSARRGSSRRAGTMGAGLGSRSRDYRRNLLKTPHHGVHSITSSEGCNAGHTTNFRGCALGERRIDVLEFLTSTRAIGADPIRLLKALMRRAV